MEEPQKMTSTGALIVPKMLFHMHFQYQRHGINIRFPVTFFEIIAASKQHVALGYWRYLGKFINNLLRYTVVSFPYITLKLMVSLGAVSGPMLKPETLFLV
ncbi:hypothetical protein [Xenorhabdus bovienii]|uniref:hypothetical protein n=2 Tax=Xenorhabdus bovienii TaxID=40576 RepID=UPI00056FFB5B|nr:hypothetical protein [Xenorhabdus bovienii]